MIINHDGHGWWDPLSSAKGDVFDLVQHLDPTLSFGHACKELRRLVGVAPTFPEVTRPLRSDAPKSFGRRALEAPAKATTGIFGLVVPVRAALHSGFSSAAAAEADIVRDGSFRNAWFAHRDEDGAVTHVEIRGPDYKGSLRGGTKTLFRFGRAGEGVCRLAVTEAPIDALSLAAIEGPRADTLHVATGGGIGPGTISALPGRNQGHRRSSRRPSRCCH